MLSQNKGIYALVTTFLFIMVVLFAVLAVIYMSSMMRVNKETVNDELATFDYRIDAKNRILSQECYGSVIQENEANETCSFPPGTIIGYEIRMLPYPNCTNATRTWSHMFSDEDGELWPYFVPIQSNATGNICPGRLMVKHG
jgi:hypothetical protein